LTGAEAAKEFELWLRLAEYRWAAAEELMLGGELLMDLYAYLETDLLVVHHGSLLA
jgi:hypothetical protein